MKEKKYFLFFAWSSILGVFIYSVARLYTFYFNEFNIPNLVFAFLLLLAEGHSIVQTIGYVAGAIRLKKKDAIYHRKVNLDLKNLPGVTVLVPARNEPKEVLELTFISLFSMKYDNKKLVFIDGSDEEFRKKNRHLANKYGIEYFVPIRTPKNKAEALNSYLPNVNTEYFAVFDADQNPTADFLLDTVAVAEFSGNIGFVQTPQIYINMESSPIAKGAAMQQSIFYESVCESKGAAEAMFCCGTNFLMRTKVFTTFGGFDEKSVTEDFATSVKIHSLGYRSIYYNHVRAFGMAPETLPAYFKQQFRWSAGSVGVLRKLIIDGFKGNLKISGLQLWEYMLSATYYFSGWSFFIMMICPMMYLLFDTPSYFANPYLYIGTFIPYYILTMSTFYFTLKGRKYAWNDIFTGIVMGEISFPILMSSTLQALIGSEFKFVITDKNQTGKIPFWGLWPWTSMMFLNCLAIIFGIMKFSSNPYAISVNIIWCSYHLLLLSRIFKLNTSPKIKINPLLKYVYK